jgi:hypothetical protein
MTPDYLLASRVRLRLGPLQRRPGGHGGCDAMRFAGTHGWARCRTPAHRLLKGGHRVCRRCLAVALRRGSRGPIQSPPRSGMPARLHSRPVLMGQPDRQEFFHYWNDGPCTGGTPFDGSPEDLPDLPRAEVEFVVGDEDALLLSMVRQHLQAAVMYFAVWVLKEAGARSPRVHEWLLEHLPPASMEWWGLLEGTKPTPLLEMLIEKVKTEPQRLFPADERREIANAIVWITLLELPPEPRVASATRALVELMGIDPELYAEVLPG